MLNAKDLARPGVRTLVAEDVLATAEQKMEASNSDRLPVVADDESGRVIGIAHRDRALRAHSKELQITWRETSGDRRKRPR